MTIPVPKNLPQIPNFDVDIVNNLVKIYISVLIHYEIQSM